MTTISSMGSVRVLRGLGGLGLALLLAACGGGQSGDQSAGERAAESVEGAMEGAADAAKDAAGAAGEAGSAAAEAAGDVMGGAAEAAGDAAAGVADVASDTMGSVAAAVGGCDAPSGELRGDTEKGKAVYGLYCITCHGQGGKGDGPAAPKEPKPADHTDPGRMGALTDGDIYKVIKCGGASVGKSPLMTPWGPVLNDQQLRDTVAFVRSLSKT